MWGLVPSGSYEHEELKTNVMSNLWSSWAALSVKIEA